VEEILKNKPTVAGGISDFAIYQPTAIYLPLMGHKWSRCVYHPGTFKDRYINSPKTAVAPPYFAPALAAGLAPLHCMVAQASSPFDDLAA
jgi:hypothetical protein